MALLAIKDLHVTFTSEDKNTYAIHDFSMELEDGNSLGIVGESGSGKSTLAMAILKLLPNNAQVEGEIDYKNSRISHMPEKEFANLRWNEIAAVFQKSMNALSPVHKIGPQLADVYKLHDKQKRKKGEVRQLIVDLLRKVNLQERVYDLYPHELSGGMMQRVSIALGLIHHPNLLIMDEATTALDVVTERQILEEIQQLERELGITRIMITHDMSVVATSCEKVAVMYSGCLMEYGKVTNVLANPQHPYTIGLIQSFASVDNKGERLKGIGGSLPDLTQERTGCIFADRCHLATEICFTVKPQKTVMRDGRDVYCHKVGAEL